MPILSIDPLVPASALAARDFVEAEGRPRDRSWHAHRHAGLVIDERDNWIRGMKIPDAWERGAVLVAGAPAPFKGRVEVSLGAGQGLGEATEHLRGHVAILAPSPDGRMRAFLHGEDGWHCPEIEALEGDAPDLEAAARELQDMLDARVEATLEPEM